MKDKFIPDEIYRQLKDLLPIVDVDIIIHCKGRYLLVKRGQEPVKGRYWLVGGRVYEGETLVRAAGRKCREEAGLKVSILGFAGLHEDFYAYPDYPHHCVTIVLLATCETDAVVLNQYHTDYQWVTREAMLARLRDEKEIHWFILYGEAL